MTHDHCMLCAMELRAAEATRERYRLALVEIHKRTHFGCDDVHELASVALSHEHGAEVGK